MNNSHGQFSLFATRMLAEGLPKIFIDSFAYYYDLLVSGKTGMIPETDILPVIDLPDMEAFPTSLERHGYDALGKTAVIKLNGGLGTGMGLEKAKSLLPVKDGHSFLDIIARQATKNEVPLVLMNSFATESDSLAALQPYSELGRGLNESFIQHKELKIVASDFSPATWPQNPDLEWCPPGHGDIYLAMVTSGTLTALLDKGFKYAFVSNADNLGAVLDLILLGYFAEQKLPFMMEVAERTEMDKKGGHLARRAADKRLILRESAQCPDEDLANFSDISRHRFFNTNNLWINLESLQDILISRQNNLGLAMIANRKTVDPRDKSSTSVYQLETAMGSAIGVFDGAQAVRVPRKRFAPVKKTNDLLAVRSDVYELSEEYHVVPNPQRVLDPIYIDLDERYYKFVSDLDQRFPSGPPSLLACETLSIIGDFCFESDVVFKGSVVLVNDTDHQIKIEAGTVLQDQE